MTPRTVYLLAMLLPACGSVPTATDGGNGGDDAGGEIDAAGPEWTVEHIEPISMGDFYHVGAHGSRIYFSRDTNGTERFFKSYQTGPGGTVQDEMLMDAAENDFCACGNNSDLVAGQGSLFYFANYGHAFDVATRMWRSINYPMQFRRGEAAVAIIGDTMLFVGGRGPIATGQSYFISPDVWDTSAPPPYLVPVQRARAVAHNGRMYVAGGSDGSVTVPFFASWAPGDVDWREHPELLDPNVQDVVAFQDDIWAFYGSNFLRFDLAGNQWLAGSVMVPVTDRAVPVVVTDGMTGEEVLYVVEAGQTDTRFLRYSGR